ncbi:MAG: hypothetical protein OEU32_11195 [Acidimicrobiia bacterium]|nr:hypothetical protein [Acidimicrobiia bacterium]
MSSWRDSVSDGTLADVEGLVRSALPVAQKALEERGGFVPYAAAVRIDDEVEIMAADMSAAIPAETDVVLEELVTDLRDRADSVRAGAVISEIRLPDSNADAIRIRVEHRDGVALDVYLRYQMVGAYGEVAYSSPVSEPGTPVIFAR